MAILSFTKQVWVNGVKVHTHKGLVKLLGELMITNQDASITCTTVEGEYITGIGFDNESIKRYYRNGLFDEIQDWVTDMLNYDPEIDDEVADTDFMSWR